MPQFLVAERLSAAWLLLLVLSPACVGATTFQSIKQDLAALSSTVEHYAGNSQLRAALLERVDFAYTRTEQAEQFYQQAKRLRTRWALQRAMLAMRGFKRVLWKGERFSQVSHQLADELRAQADHPITALQDFKQERFGENTPPIADAGPDQAVHVGDEVTLDGTGSSDPDDQSPNFFWETVDPDGVSITLDDPTSPTPGFVVAKAGDHVATLIVDDGIEAGEADTVLVTTLNVPPVAVAAPEGSAVAIDDAAAIRPTLRPDMGGDYLLQLIVSDGVEDSPPDTVRLVTLNARPLAVAGEDQTVGVGSTVFVNGSDSYDADGDPLHYHWSIASAPQDSIAVLHDTNTLEAYLVVDQPGDYALQLIVDDGELHSVPDVVNISTVNSPPVADVGNDVTAHQGSVVMLDGSRSHDVDFDPLTCQWSLLSTPTCSSTGVRDPLAAQTEIGVDEPGSYLVQLVVNDGAVDSVSDNALITVEVLQNHAPQITSTPPGGASVNTLYQYAFTASDPDGDPLYYRLAQSPGTMRIDASGLITWVPGTEGAQTV